MSYPKFLTTSINTIFTTLFSQHIILFTVTPSSDVFLSLNKGIMSTLTFIQLITLSLYTVSMVTLYLLILSTNDFHLICLTAHNTYLYLYIVLLLLLYTQVFLMVGFLALYFSPCTLSLCLPLLIHTVSLTILLLMAYNSRCLLLFTIYPCSLYRVICK